MIQQALTSSRNGHSTSSYDCTGFMMKLMMFLFGGKFREHNMTILRNFKAYCEEGRDVRASGGS